MDLYGSLYKFPDLPSFWELKKSLRSFKVIFIQHSLPPTPPAFCYYTILLATVKLLETLVEAIL